MPNHGKMMKKLSKFMVNLIYPLIGANQPVQEWGYRTIDNDNPYSLL